MYRSGRGGFASLRGCFAAATYAKATVPERRKDSRRYAEIFAALISNLSQRRKDAEGFAVLKVWYR